MDKNRIDAKDTFWMDPVKDKELIILIKELLAKELKRPGFQHNLELQQEDGEALLNSSDPKQLRYWRRIAKECDAENKRTHVDVTFVRKYLSDEDIKDFLLEILAQMGQVGFQIPCNIKLGLIDMANDVKERSETGDNNGDRR